jgi:hypothetical protein
MLVASLVTSPGIVVLRMEDLSTLPARLAINAENLVTCKDPSLACFVTYADSRSSRDCPQKATNGELSGDAVDLGVAPVAPVAPVA